MHGNYRHHYLLSSAASQAPNSMASKAPRSQQQQTQLQLASNNSNNNFNGLPDSSQMSSVGGGNGNSIHMSAGQNLQISLANRQHHQQQQQQQQLYQMSMLAGGKSQSQPQRPARQQQQESGANCCPGERQIKQQLQLRQPPMSREYFGQQQEIDSAKQQFTGHNSISASSINNNNNNNLAPTKPTNRRPTPNESADRNAANQNQLREDQYASQLRKTTSQFNYRVPAHTQPGGGPLRAEARLSPAGSSHRAVGEAPMARPGEGPPSGAPTSSSRSPSDGRSPLHVNFNRAGQSTAAADEDDEGDTRKKKYLTAKYGQQQMNLIKKRLKIEMWLYEQLQELAKGSKSEAELDEIDIDLDQLLDMDDDDTRRHWLKKTLSPFDDLPAERIDKFIGDVLEQAKLL